MVEIGPGKDSRLSKNPEQSEGLNNTAQQCKGPEAAVSWGGYKDWVREGGWDEACKAGATRSR